MSFDTTACGKRVRQLRRQHNLTQLGLCEKLNISETYLRKIESESGARVQFLQGKDRDGEREATISGSMRSREDAKNAIFGIIEENGGANVMQDKGAYTAGMPGRAKVNLPALRDGEDSQQIMVPDKTVGLVIGRGGETIKDLQEKSGCHVNILGESKSINGLRPVNLIGSPESVQN